MENLVNLVIVVLPFQAWRVDAVALTDTPGVQWAIITDAGSVPLLDTDRFAWVEVANAFDAESLAGIVRRRCASGRGVRLVAIHEGAVRATAQARERLGLAGPGEASVHHFLDKPAMKQRLAISAADLLPRWRVYDTEAAARAPKAYITDLLHDPGLPIFAKPIDSVGSEGTALLANEHDIERFLAAAGKRPYELDEYLHGPVYNADAVLFGGKVEWFGVCELLNPPSEVLQRGRALASWTLPADAPEFAALRKMVDRVIAAMEPPDGAIHLEGIRTARGFRFLEVACRPAGWLIPEAYLAAEGIDLRVGHLHAAAGIAPSIVPTLRRTGGYYAAIKTRPGNIVGHRTPMLDVPHRCTHRPGRAGPAPSPGIFTHYFVCEVVAWHEEAKRLREALRGLNGFEPYVLADAAVEIDPRTQCGGAASVESSGLSDNQAGVIHRRRGATAA